MASLDISPAVMSSLRRAELPPGPSFPVALCAHAAAMLPDYTVHETSGGNGNTVITNLSETDCNDRELKTIELLNASLPQVLCSVENAGKAFSEKQFDELCAHLEQASALLQAVIVTVIPTAVIEEARPEEPPVVAPTVEEPIEIERPRAMAVAA